MLTHPRRLISAALSALLGVAFVAVALGIGDALNATVERDARASIGTAAVVVTPAEPDGSGYEPVTGAYAAALQSLPGVTEVREVVDTYVTQRTRATTAAVSGKTTPKPDSGYTIKEGRLPTAPGEVAVNDSFVEHREGRIGGTVLLGEAKTRGPVAKIVGVLTPKPGVDRQGAPTVYAANADLLAWADRPASGAYDEVLVTASDADPEALRHSAAALPGRGKAVVRTTADEVAARVAKLDQDSGVFTLILLSFAAISVMVSSIVIANTFTIVVAQQTRALALLRCVGATRRQVFRQVLLDASVTAAVASVAGVLLGTGLIAALTVFSKGTVWELAGVSPSLLNIGVPLLVGMLVTVGAALVPARKATRTAPLAALRTDLVSSEGNARPWGVVAGVVLMLGGTAALVAGAVQHQLPVGLLGGAASLVGLVMAGRLIVPALARVLGVVPARMAGLPGQLAVDNSRRNPGRAAATASALVVGVTLITLMTVGAASGQASVEAELDQRLPVDATVSAAKGLPASAAAKAAGSPGVTAVTRVESVTVDIESAGATVEQLDLMGFAPDATSVLRAPQFVEGVRDDALLLDSQMGIKNGSPVRLRAGGRTVEVRAVVRDLDVPPVTSLATLQRLAGSSTPTKMAVWVRFADDADGVRATEQLRSAMDEIPGAQIGGAAAERVEMRQIIDIVLYVVTGLLGVAVVIALVGIGNTLGLSVLERTRENGLLRALGVTRRQVRSMLGVEALVLAGVGTVVGIATGIGYGIAGSHALLGGIMDIQVTVPWERLALVAVVAMAAGWAASVLPGRRAANVPPSAALATD